MSDGDAAAQQPDEHEKARAGAGQKVASGGFLVLVGSFASRFVGTLSLIVLGRLLLPEDFGVMALAMLMLELTHALMNRQFELALVRMPEVEEEHFDTAFTMAFLVGLVLSIVLFLSADLVASLVNEPRLVPVLQLVSLLPIVDGLRNPRFVRYERTLNFLPEMSVDFSTKMAQAGVAILFAFLWGDYWALVVGAFVFSVGQTVLTHIVAPSRPRFTLKHARIFFAFGGWLTGTGLVSFIYARTDTALVGANLSTATVGIYNIGVTLTIMMTDQVANPLARAVLPGLRLVAGDRERLNRAYYKAQQVMLGLMLPIGVGLALVAPEAIRLILGPNWSMAAPVVMALAPVSALSTVFYVIQAVNMVEGNTRAMFYRNLIVAVVQVPLMVFGIWAAGLEGLLAARIVGLFVNIGLALGLAVRFTGDPFFTTFTVAWRSFASTAAMAAVVLALDPMLPTATTTGEAALVLIAKVAAGALAYCGTHLALWRTAGCPDGVEQTLITFAWRILGRLRLVPQT